MDWNGLNRRQFPRIVYPCLVKISQGAQSQGSFLTHTENIGVGGFCVILKQEIPFSSPVEVEIDLVEETENIKARGRVVWTVRREASQSLKPLFYGIGVEFENLGEKDKGRLKTATESFVKRGYKALKPVY